MSPEQCRCAPTSGVYFHWRGTHASKMYGAPGALGEAQPFRPGCFELGFHPVHSPLSPTKHTLALPSTGKERAKAGDQGSKVGSLLLWQGQGRRFSLIKLPKTNFHFS